MENFFANFLGEDSIYIMLVSLFCFLIGFITAWLLWRGRAKRFEKEAAQWKKQYDDLVLQHTKLKEEMELKDADLVKAKREATEANSLYRALEADKAKWQSDLDAALEESVRAQANASSYREAIEDLNSQIVGLKAMNAELNDSLSGVGGSNDSSGAKERIKELEAKLNALESEKAALANTDASVSAELDVLRASFEQANARIKELEATAKELQLANVELQVKLDQQDGFVASQGVVLVAEPDEALYAPTPETTTVDKGETLTFNAIAARDRIKSAIGKKLPPATEADKDDLTKINGIGSFLEKKLNATGIYTYEQISALDAETIEYLTTAIEFFPGRIEKDDWVGQAKALLKVTPAVADPAVDMGNLRIVEGIGPKIEGLLKENGIADLKALSEAKEKRLREILFAAGSRYRIHDPSTWPEQASLAVKGEMDALQELQDRLKGGRDVG